MVKLSGNYLKATEAKTGDIIEFMNAGEWQKNTKYSYPDGNPKQDFVVKVTHSGQEKSFRINKTNREKLVENLGDETENWIGKKARINLMDALVSGKPVKIIILEVSNGKPKPELEAWDK